jgi:phage terminase large subunit-like protein
VKCPAALHATPADETASSRGPQLARVAELLGFDLFGWQRQVADVSLEIDDTTGLFRRRTVAVSVGRQNGKTLLLTARIALELLSGGHVAYTAQDRSMAALRFREMVEMMRPAIGSRFGTLRLANGSESLSMLNGGSLRVVTPSREGARGLTLDLVVVDEALAHTMELVAAIGPTMSTRPNAQLWIASNAGTSDSEMLRHFRDLGRSGDSESLAWFEWAAGDDDDPDDPDVWARAIPTLNETRGVTMAAVTDAHATMTAELFDREMLNRWPLDAADYALDVTRFAALAGHDAEHGDRFAIGVDISPMRDTASICIASLTADGRQFVELVDHRPGVGWVAARLAELAARWHATIVIDAGAAAGNLLPHLTAQHVTELNARDYASACATFYDAVQNGTLTHLGDQLLTDAVGSATRRRLGDRWAWKRSSNDGSPITPLVAATLAVWGAVTVPQPPTPKVH